jgi:hypothetical protein
MVEKKSPTWSDVKAKLAEFDRTSLLGPVKELLTGGVSATAKGGTMLSLGGEYGGLDASYEIWTGNARATMPF